jgi:hypothetical protein
MSLFDTLSGTQLHRASVSILEKNLDGCYPSALSDPCQRQI